jgi:hypothetical protein
LFVFMIEKLVRKLFNRTIHLQNFPVSRKNYASKFIVQLVKFCSSNFNSRSLENKYTNTSVSSVVEF